jgi:hypothetical protein
MLSWGAATDNYGIKSYLILVNGKLVATIGGNNLSYRLKDYEKRSDLQRCCKGRRLVR